MEHKYEVSVFSCHCPIPFSMASHCWFVINKSGTLSRWEILFRKKPVEGLPKHLYKNAFGPYEGIGIFPYSKRLLWSSKLIGTVEGGDGSVAERLAEYIENSASTYQYRDSYSILGPNSNTYVSEILSNFPEVNIPLPMNAVGKSFRHKVSSNLAH